MTGDIAALRNNPFALLQALDARMRVAHAELAAGGEQVWTGVALRVGEQWLVAPRADVREILSRPTLTRVPGAKAFLRGVANLRGALLPVTDLGLLSGAAAVVDRRDRRVVVLNSRHIPAGFLVDEVGGYRSFAPEDQRHALVAQARLPREWLLGVFVRDAQTWPVLSLQRVARSDVFVHAGAEMAGRAGGNAR